IKRELLLQAKRTNCLYFKLVCTLYYDFIQLALIIDSIAILQEFLLFSNNTFSRQLEYIKCLH
ncbi:MAG: hypothetical protein J7J31_07015, partial [Helicobacteraceae bacterium]|nr:hypothetical protein [Helicobacteraceae bacterium]